MDFRTYQDTDYEAVCRFLIALNREDRRHVNWNWARFEWMYEHPGFVKETRKAFGLWWEKGSIVGAAICDMYFGEAFCGVLPEYAALYPQVLDYAWAALKDDAGLGIAICDDNAGEIEAAAAKGFVRAEQRETILSLPLDRALSAELPAGFITTEPDPVKDACALQWLFWQGFDHGNDRAQFEREEQIVPRIRKHFNRNLGLAAADPSGELAAICCLWYHPDTDYAYVEPVCTIPAHRGKGLAKALLCETLNRARALGAKKAYVISDLDFYTKIGFRREFSCSFYWKT